MSGTKPRDCVMKRAFVSQQSTLVFDNILLRFDIVIYLPTTILAIVFYTTSMVVP